MIHDGIADVFRRVSRSFKDLDFHVLDLKAVSLGESYMLELAFACLRDIDLCSGLFSQIQMARDKIGVEMGFKNVGNLQPHRLGRIKVDLNIPARVNDGTGLCASQEIRSMSQTTHKK